MDIETEALVERWILTFCEPPVLVDTELMRRVLDEADQAKDEQAIEGQPPGGASALRSAA